MIRKIGLREGGEIVNQTGYFHATGNRLAFVSADNKRNFIALENRNLERVAQAIAENAKTVGMDRFRHDFRVPRREFPPC